MISVEDLTVILPRVLSALFVGVALGLNRDLHNKSAGVRTHALVTLGAAFAVLALVDPHAASGYPVPDSISRVVQGVVTGVGFLGAGVILRDPEGHVYGLTTAATIWVAATLGMLCGLGHWPLVASGTVLVLLVLILGGPFEHWVERIIKGKKKPHPVAPR